MFDNIVVYRNSGSGRLIDLGMLAEALLFYDSVHLLLNRGTLISLLDELGADGIDQFIERPELRFSYLKQNFGTFGNTTGGLRALSFAIFEVGGVGRRKVNTNRDDLEQTLERSLGRSAVSRKRVSRLLSAMSFPRVEDDMPPNQLTEGARNDLDDQSFVHDAVDRAMAALVPEYRLPSGWHFRVFKLNDGSFAVDTNLDYQAINREYHKTTSPEHSSISTDYLINFIYDAYIGTYLASRYSAEFVHDPLCSSIMKLKYVHLFRRRERSIKEIDLFQNLHLDGRNIRGAINSKARSFEEFLELLDHAAKFKKWLRETNPDQKLVKEYFEAVTRETWIDRLPTKGMRWIITTGLASIVEALYPTGAAMAAAQGLSLADATVLDRIVKGWKPDQFVNGSLSEFLGSEANG